MKRQSVFINAESDKDKKAYDIFRFELSKFTEDGWVIDQECYTVYWGIKGWRAKLHKGEVDPKNPMHASAVEGN